MDEEVKCMCIWVINVCSGDFDNLEVCVVVYYWKFLFLDVDSFIWECEGIFFNNLLNYGYVIFCVVVVCGLVISGLFFMLGIYYYNCYNVYCLVDDIMEFYCFYVDELVFSLI